jgi:hypothetical protein
MATDTTQTTPPTTEQSVHISNIKPDTTTKISKDDTSDTIPNQNTDKQTANNANTNVQINTNTTRTSNPILSSQPRFSTSDIVKKFPHIKPRYCHKIKISLPWDDKQSAPTSDTYYKPIHHFFQLVKSYDPQFQLLTWDIINKECNTISDVNRLPKSHNELSSYLYNVHMTPSRVRASMVVNSSYNLADLIHTRYRLDKTQTDLLKTFRQEKLWVQPTNIQTMGEIKLIGFLQYVHPKYTNLKKLTIELQAIVETRDISVEIYRPRAVDTKGKIITAPEAIAIGAPSDISIDVYKSLIDKWSEVLDGEYDMVIGKDSTLKMGYFIPFTNGLLSRSDKNEAILNHEKFLKEFTSIKLRQCSSVDSRFPISKCEMDLLNLQTNKKRIGDNSKTTLRRILNSWKNDKDPHYLIQSIEQFNTTTQLLVVKKRNKSEILNQLHLLLNTLKVRSDFSSLCGNSDGRGAFVDKFTFSTTGYNYLTYLKGSAKLKDTHHQDSSDDSIDITDNPTVDVKRKLQQITTRYSFTDNPEPSVSPSYKKSTSGSTLLHGNDEIPTYSMTTTIADSHHKKPNVSFQQALLTNTKQTNLSTQANNDSCLTTLTKSALPATVSSQQGSSQQLSRNVIKHINVPSTTVTLSTVTPTDMCNPLSNHNMITRLSDKQVTEITNAVSSQYDSVIQHMREAHATQIKSILQTQQMQENEINGIKASQLQLKTDMQDQLDKKMTTQNTLLHSMVSMIKDIQCKQHSDDKERLRPSTGAPQCTKNKVLTPTVINHSQDHDISYSESESEHDSEGQTEIMTAATVQSSIASSRPGSTNYVRQLHDNIDDQCTSTSTDPKPSTTLPCKHINDIEVESTNDIRHVTLTSTIGPNEVNDESGWNDVTDTSKNKVLLKHAIISPFKRRTRSSYKRGSPNYNHYDPTGSIQRTSQRLQNKQLQQMKDRSQHHIDRKSKSDRKP